MFEQEIKSERFLKSSGKKKSDFTRNRKLAFPKVCLFLLGIVHEWLSVALRRFTEKIGEEMTITQQSLSKARDKIKWGAFAELSEKAGRFAYTGGYDRWHGYRVWGVDGTKRGLPNYPELGQLWGNEEGSPMERGSILYDVINYTVFDAQIEPLSVDERSLAEKHIDGLIERMGTQLEKELLVYDRGYPSEELLDYHETNGLFYLMRVRSKFDLDVDKQESADGFVQIGQNKVRVVKVTLDTGEVGALLTDLVGNFDFKELYFLRRGVEKEYDVLKNTLEIENFSGRTETTIRQDFHIHIIASNMLAASFWEAQEIVDQQRNSGKVNVAQAASVLRDYLVLAILADAARGRKRLLKKMRETIASAVIPVRPDRFVLRKENNTNAKFHHNSKPNL